MVKYLFDLDGTLTAAESLAMAASRLCLGEAVALTAAARSESSGYADNLRRRVELLSAAGVSAVADIIGKIAPRPLLLDFVRRNAADCAIVSSNLRCWCGELTDRFGCESHLSEATVVNDRIVSFDGPIDKARVVEEYKRMGRFTVFIGDGLNDVEAMRAADVAVAIGEDLHEMVVDAADYFAADERGLIAILESVGQGR